MYALVSDERPCVSDCWKAGLEKEWGRSSCRFYAERELSSESKKDSKSKVQSRASERASARTESKLHLLGFSLFAWSSALLFGSLCVFYFGLLGLARI